jgi:hypothetical protein
LLQGTVDRIKAYFSNHPEVDMVYGDRVFMDADSRVRGVWRLLPHCGYLMSRWDYIPQESAFWRRDLMDRVGGVDVSLRFAMDYDLFVRMMERGNVRHVREYFAAFRTHEASKTQLLNATVGKDEVRQVRSRYGVRMRSWDRIIGGILRRMVERASAHAFDGASRQMLQASLDRSVAPV